MVEVIDALRSAGRPAARSGRRAIARARNVAVRYGGLPERGSVAVSYGHYRLPGSDRYTHGGLVKLQALDRAFPHAPLRFNVLYLVSSRLPEDAAGLADSAREKGARIVINQNGVAYPAWHGPGWDRTNAPMAELVARADHVLYQSEFCRVSADRFLGAARCPSEILYNPVDTSRFVPATRPRRAPTVLLGGTQDLLYRVTTALDALAIVARRVPDVRLIVAGRLRWITDEGEALRFARAYADRCGVGERVSFVGPYSQDDAPALYQRGDLLLHAKYNDPCPTVVLEAMACGLPIVYSKSGGVPELVGDEAGVGVPAPLSWDEEHPPAPDRMADAVLDAFERREALSAAARQRAVDRFGVSRWLDRHRQVFESLLS